MGNSETPPLGVRVPDRIRQMLDQAAKANNRSRNAEIVSRLTSSFERRETELQVGESDPKRYIDKIVLTEIEWNFMTIFRKWRPEQQLAFLSLFKE